MIINRKSRSQNLKIVQEFLKLVAYFWDCSQGPGDPGFKLLSHGGEEEKWECRVIHSHLPWIPWYNIYNPKSTRTAKELELFQTYVRLHWIFFPSFSSGCWWLWLTLQPAGHFKIMSDIEFPLIMSDQLTHFSTVRIDSSVLYWVVQTITRSDYNTEI